MIARFDKNTKRKQLLKDHLRNVATLAGYYGEFIRLQKTMSFLGYIHDMGKASYTFEKKITLAFDGQNEEADRIHCDHGAYGARFLHSLYVENPDIKGGKVATEIMAMVVCGHHGGLDDCVDESLGSHRNPQNAIPIMKRIEALDEKDYAKAKMEFEKMFPDATLKDYFESACEEISDACEEIKKLFPESTSFYLGLLIKTMYSMLIDADRYDSALFERGIEDVRPYCIESQKVSWKEYASRLESYLESINGVCNLKPGELEVNEVRKMISDECYRAAFDNKGIKTLTVPTGGGKTFSSLRFALNHAEKHNMNRIFYIIPLLTILEQNAEEVRNAIDCSELLEHHSNIVENNKSEDYDLLTARWSDPIIFSTMIQFLNSFFDSKTQNMRRIHNMMNSIFIFDEIQTLPIKCISLFNSVVNFLTEYLGATVVLCTATQPNLGELPFKKRNLFSGDEIITDVAQKYEMLKRVDVTYEKHGTGFTFEEAASYISDRKKAYGSILVVTNKIDSAIKLYCLAHEMKDTDTEIFFLSSDLCPAHRTDVIRKLKKALIEKRNLICISTQLIEAGVDISFDFAVRCLAGLDSIAQTSGRVNRHGERESGECTVIVLKDESLARLTEIALGAKHTEEVLYDYEQCPDKYNMSLLSPEAIKKYYELYYNDKKIEENMDYPMKNERDTIYGWLTSSKRNLRNYTDITGEEYPLALKYSFKRASKEFKVIDDDTSTVVVPYKHGKELITQMNNDNYYLSLDDKLSMIEKIKPFCVSIRRYRFDKISESKGVYFNQAFGVYTLSDDFYDEVKGVRDERKMDTLTY